TISNLTIADGNADFGGAISNRFGTSLTVENCTISGNVAGSIGGGGIANIGATTTIINSTISGNTTSSVGGGIANAFGTVTITNSTISGNSATGSSTSSEGGGGIFNGSSGGVNLTNSTITNNSSSNFGSGGGVQNPSIPGCWLLPDALRMDAGRRVPRAPQRSKLRARSQRRQQLRA